MPFYGMAFYKRNHACLCGQFDSNLSHNFVKTDRLRISFVNQTTLSDLPHPYLQQSHSIYYCRLLVNYIFGTY